MSDPFEFNHAYLAILISSECNGNIKLQYCKAKHQLTILFVILILQYPCHNTKTFYVCITVPVICLE